MRRFLAPLALLSCLLAGSTDAPAAPRAPIELKDALFIGQPGVFRREPLHSDAIEAQLVAGSFNWPSAGDWIELADGKRLAWESVEVDDKGTLRAQGMRGGYVAWSVHSDERRIVLLEARGHTAVWFDGSWLLCSLLPPSSACDVF